MTYDETLALLDTWYGRPVLMSIQPDGCHWYASTIAARLPRRAEIGLEWLEDDLPHASEGWTFSMAGGAAHLQLVRGDFREARLDEEGSLVIRLAGAVVMVGRRP